MRTCFVLFLLLLFSFGIAVADTIERAFVFDAADVYATDSYDRITMNNALLLANPGEPTLPIVTSTLLLPPGHELIDVQVISSDWELVSESVLPEPFGQLMPISRLEVTEPVPDPAIYSGGGFFPETIISDVQTGFLRGHSIANYIVHPVRWNAATGELFQLTTLEVRLVTEETERATASLSLLRNSESTQEMLESITSDLDYATSYSMLDELDEVDPGLLIICSPTTEDTWEEYAAFKRSRGLETIILNTTDIYSEYAGDDNAMKVRNAIIDMYQEYDIEHVILGGDVQHIPYRGFYDSVGQEVDENIPADLYFAGLDGTWNNDGDNRWGEQGEDDLYQEITIGRVPITSTTVLENWIDKQVLYQTEPVLGEVTEALMVGEDLGWTSWGGDYKDEVRNGSSNYGYTTIGFPGNWNVETLYDRNSTWTVPQLFAELNSGFHFVNHLGHANVEYALKASRSQITDANLTNDGVDHTYYLVYTQGCLCGAFEQTSITEQWTTIDNGAFAFISNSRYGWGSSSNTNGPSQRFDRQFFDAVFGEMLYQTGVANRDSKHDNVSVIGYECMRWCYYEINLFGDPTVDLYTNDVEELDVTIPSVYVIGSAGILATVDGVYNATIAVSNDGVLLETYTTNSSGHADMILDISEPAELDIVVTAHNYLPYQTTIQAIAPEGGYPVLDSWFVADEEQGNDNEQADFGENFDLSLNVANRGQDALGNLIVTVTTESEWIQVASEPFEVGELASEASTVCEFASFIPANVPDGTEIQFDVHFQDGEDEWLQQGDLTLHAPQLEMYILAVDDSDGDVDHRADAGETVTISVYVVNNGSADLAGATLVTQTNDPYIANISADPAPMSFPCEDEQEYMDVITLTVGDDVPSMARAWLLCNLEHENGYNWATFLPLELGGIFEDCEGESQAFDHYSLNENPDEWHISDVRNYTPNGSYAWKVGDDGTGDYSDDLDACLQLPAIEVNGSVRFSFRHWMQAEISGSFEGYCYDGGLIEISSNGENWFPLPMDGYNYITRGTGPLGEGVEVYSGEIDWEEDSYTVTTSAGQLYIRFHFGSDGGVSEEGWYIDHISITLPPSTDAPADLSGEILDGMAELSWCAPYTETDEDDMEGFYVYRNNECLTEYPVVDLAYSDPLGELPNGDYTYYVTAVFDGEETGPSTPITLVWDSDAVVPTELPSSWSISSPYPNPFNPSFTVRVTMPEAANVRANLYNILGQHVAVVNDGMMNAGQHAIMFRADGLASGVYVLSVELGPLHQAHKIVLMK